MNEHIISQVPLFARLPPSEIEYLARSLRPAEFPAGTLLFREGEHGDHFYIVRQGYVDIIKALGTPDERLLGRRGPGQYIGEMSLLNRDGLRTATARTGTTANLLEMTRADFDALLTRQPTLAYEMVRELSLRLKQAQNEALRDLSEKNRQLTEAYESLKAAQEQIIRKEKLEHELLVAREVQASLLPQDTPHIPGWEFAAHWQPAREVSGDFYDFLPLNWEQAQPAAEARWGVVIADVSDKGMPAALFMALSRSIVRASLTSGRTPAESITQANRLISADAGQGMFVTLFYAQLDAAAGELTYVNGGHNPPWVFRAEKAEWLELARTGTALGMFGAQRLSERLLTLHSGDMLFLYTDGLTDVVNAAGERFGPEPVRHLLQAHRHASADDMVARLVEAVNDFRADQPLFDDITLVLIKRQ